VVRRGTPLTGHADIRFEANAFETFRPGRWRRVELVASARGNDNRMFGQAASALGAEQ
jgi:hypothetical protein